MYKHSLRAQSCRSVHDMGEPNVSEAPKRDALQFRGPGRRVYGYPLIQVFSASQPLHLRLGVR